jgi:PAS domain S-box-containing protein
MGFLGIAIAASLKMANSVIKTEEALEEHRQNLEGLVATRTAELSQSNEQLMREIERRERAEVVLRESEATARALLNAPTDAAALLDPAGLVLDANEAMAQRYNLRPEELVGTTIWDLMPPDVASRRQAATTQVIQSGRPTRFEDRLEEIWNDNVIYPVFDPHNKVTKIAVIAHDITNRKRAEQALNRRLEELSILHQTAQTVANVSDLSTALDQVAEMIAYLFNVLSTHIAVLADGEQKLKLMARFVREPVPPEAMTTTSFPIAELPITREILSTGQSRVVYDLQSLPLPPSISEAVAAFKIYTILLVPLMSHGIARGILTISTDQVDRKFSKDEVQLAETIAGDIAAAIETSRLLEQTKAAAATEERNRIARELHDSVTQSMYSVSIVAEALPRMLERNLEEAKRNAGYLRQTTLGALAEMRTLLFELRPDSLAKARLNVLLQQLADALTGRTRVPVEVTIHGQATLPTEIKIALYRIAQEAFNNINKHAKATQAWVALHRDPDRVILVIRDNGQGFDPAAVPEERLGLRIMRERAAHIGANLTLESGPGQGVQVAVTWTDPAGQFVTESENNT